MVNANYNLLVIGSGGREHALAWKLSQSDLVGKVFVAPGNGGTEELNVEIKANDFAGLSEFAMKNSCVTLVGPEVPLSSGIVDYFSERQLPIAGPTRDQAKLEWSKSYAKEMMRGNNIPTAQFQVFSEAEKAIDYAYRQSGRVVVKADGLAAGKGVFVCSSPDDAERAIRSVLKDRIFGESGSEIVVEEKLEGREISLMTISDGSKVLPFGTATDHKRALDGDKGPNTGGMGAYSPALRFGDREIEDVMQRVVRPIVRLTGFRGFLYVGLMLTSSGPKVIEFNSRLGDPETQVIIPRLETDLLEPVLSVAQYPGWPSIADIDLRWSKLWFSAVVMCSEGYPSNPRTGDEIAGIERAEKVEQTVIFHSGTKRTNGILRTNGGRVLCVTAAGETLDESTARAYSSVNLISWKGEHHRHDIGIPAASLR
ncbi:MAG: phosphoribosylamine--glycine ligase [Nitrososphaerota archaeon]|nr:phosphoribosylamine--glycine ligase [Nitrososphaerota archaeon]